MPGSLAVVVGILNADGTRADAPAADGTYKPIMIKAGISVAFSAVDRGSYQEITATASDGMTSIVPFTTIDDAPHDLLVYEFPDGTTPTAVHIKADIRWIGTTGGYLTVDSGDGGSFEGSAYLNTSTHVATACGSRVALAYPATLTGTECGGYVSVYATPSWQPYSASIYCSGADRKVYIRVVGNPCRARRWAGGYSAKTVTRTT